MSKYNTKLITEKNINQIYGMIKKFFESSGVNKKIVSRFISESRGHLADNDIFPYVGDRIYMDGNKIIVQRRQNNPKLLINSCPYIYTAYEKGISFINSKKFKSRGYLVDPYGIIR